MKEVKYEKTIYDKIATQLKERLSQLEKDVRLRIDYEEIERKTGIKFTDIDSLFHRILRDTEFLKAHNKNYTKQQYYIVEELFDIISHLGLYEEK